MINITNLEFLKHKYKYNLVSHNLDSDNSIVIDNNDYVIVYGKNSHAVWVWANDDVEDVKLLEIMNILEENCEDDNINICCNKKIYEYLIKCGYDISSVFTYACYKCEKLIVPTKVDGYITKLTERDKEFVARNWKKNCDDFGYNTPYDICLKFVDSWIKSNNFYLWKNDMDEIVAFVGYDVVDETAEISHAYTVSSERGKGYMSNLVYEVTKIIFDKKLVPVLNTDYNYTASNKAYKKIGYEETDLIFDIKLTLKKVLDKGYTK